jgi:urease beta subunit
LNRAIASIFNFKYFHFFEANLALDFERDKAYGKHLDIPAGAAVRFEPGDVKQVFTNPRKP